MKKALAAIAALPPLLLWPLPLVWSTALLTEPSEEGATHTWGLWRALHDGTPFLIDTPLMAWPDGMRLALIDPANLPWFALGGWAGPAAGFNTVLWGGIVLLGVAGAMLARQVGGRPWLGAVAAMCSPIAISGTSSGMTEMMGAGWIGIQLALLLAFLDVPGWRRGLLASLALAATWHAGPYNGIWASLLDAAVVLSRWRDRRTLLGGAAVGGLGALLVLPWASGLVFDRPQGLPGSAVRSGLPELRHLQDGFRGGLQTGTDLLDPWLPVQLTGGQALISSTAYLGLALMVAAAVVVWRDRRLWPWLAGALAFSILSLGPHLYFKGQPVQLGDKPLLAPAGVAVLLLPFLGRLTHWYRASAAAALLLTPLASKSRWPLLVAPLLVLDALFCAPLAWPLVATPMPDTAPYQALRGEGALLEIPPTTPTSPAGGAWRERSSLAQAVHGRPIGGTVMGLKSSKVADEMNLYARTLLNRGKLRAEERQRMLDAGFRWVAIYPQYRPLPVSNRDNLVRCLGEPVAMSDEVWIFALEGEGDCPP